MLRVSCENECALVSVLDDLSKLRTFFPELDSPELDFRRKKIARNSIRVFSTQNRLCGKTGLYVDRLLAVRNSRNNGHGQPRYFAHQEDFFRFQVAAGGDT